MRYTIFNTPGLKTLLLGISLFLLKILGWKKRGDLPDLDKYVVVLAPHTSNWDLFYAILIAYALKIDARFMAKKELFRGPLYFLMMWLGGIPVDRSLSSNTVDQMISTFNESSKFILALAPEGTRGKMNYWKSGFYHIAVKAHVPILLVYLDYAGKTGGAGSLIYPTGDMEQDMQAIRNFYQTVQARHPEKTGRVILHSKI